MVFASPRASRSPEAHRLRRSAKTAVKKLVFERTKDDARARLRAAARANRLVNQLHAIDPAMAEDLREELTPHLAEAMFRTRVSKMTTGVELETAMNDEILQLLQTDTGTLAAVLPYIAPKERPIWAKSQTPWQTLTTSQKRYLFDRIAPQYFLSRKIHGITVAEYPDLLPYIEHTPPNPGTAWVELHTKAKGPAQALLQRTFRLADTLKSKTENVHQHITAPLMKTLRGNPVERAMFIDFYRRINLVAEFQTVLSGRKLGPNDDEFDFLKSRDLERLHDGFDGMIFMLKFKAIGLRPGELYGDENLIGLELRNLKKQRVLSGDDLPQTVQRAMATKYYGPGASSVRKWLAQTPTVAQSLARVHYNKDEFWDLEKIPTDLQPDFLAVHVQFEEQSTQHYGLRMLIHDWNADPIVTSQAGLPSQVRRAQKRALRAYLRGDSANSVTRKFVLESGLYPVFAHSVGMKTPWMP